ncbi:MAG: DUF5752 family protein [Bryobacteraceae bacterium]
MNDAPPFTFYTERRLVLLTGRKARNLQELASHLREVSGSSVFYHTHHQFLSHHFEKPVYHNEFANWVGDALQYRRLSEELTAVDLLACTSVRQIREQLLARIENYLGSSHNGTRDCRPGEEFHFCESQSFIMTTGLVARDVPEFFATLPRVSNVSLFFHFFEARLRLENPTNDFSQWLSYRGQEDLADEFARLDPYGMTLDEVRDEMIRCGERHGMG